MANMMYEIENSPKKSKKILDLTDEMRVKMELISQIQEKLGMFIYF